MSQGLAIRRAELGGELVDVVIDGSRITDIVTTGTAAASVDVDVDADGGALLPGLHDHHIHLLALAAAKRSVVCGPPNVRDEPSLVRVLRSAAVSTTAETWIRGVGYHESVAGDLDRLRLDTVVADVPCRLQHRSGHAWFLNSAGLAAAHISGDSLPHGVERDPEGRPTGRIFGLDDWLRERVPSATIDLSAVGRDLVGFGVTAVTDATPFTAPDGVELLAAAIRHGGLKQKVVITGSPLLTPEGSLERGPAKIIIADHDLPGLDGLVAAFAAARRQRRNVAVHCVTRAALLLALTAWDEIGPEPGDRIEHAAVVPLEVADTIARLGLTVVTQPGFVATRGDDYLDAVDTADQPHLWRCASLIAAGVRVGFGTDAPFGSADPWETIVAAVDRRTPSGALLGPDERLAPSAALDRFLTPLSDPGGTPRRLCIGAPADLCLLGVPLAVALADPSSRHVRMTVAAGLVTPH